MFRFICPAAALLALLVAWGLTEPEGSAFASAITDSPRLSFANVRQ
jgi:hypothetical protein